MTKHVEEVVSDAWVGNGSQLSSSFVLQSYAVFIFWNFVSAYFY